MEYEEFEQIVWGDHEDFEFIGSVKIEDTSRWSIYNSQIVEQKSTGKRFKAYWGEGATEMQEGQSEPWSLTEVEPKEVVVIEYNTVEHGERYEGYSP